MKRTVTAEWLDTDAGTPAEIAAALKDLRRINDWFGGISTTQWMLERVSKTLQKKTLSVLEVAAGSGYVAAAVRERLQARGIHFEITLLDRAFSHLTGPSSNVRPKRLARAVVGDALSLPFPDSSFDVVSCNLFVHHLSPAELALFVGEAMRVCRAAMLINDLIRDPIHLALVFAGFPLYRSRITRHDAPASVRQAYTEQEIKEILTGAGVKRLEIHKHYLFRMGVIGWHA
ncbi:MAG: methyltransferase domain-containing protein [Acidobacteriales bacterium]|nr:methyltransferase domain-containing protein [Terriglobales bacterium]